MVTARTELLDVPADECLRLLTTHRPRLGRLAFVSGGRPQVFPMNYVAVGRLVYFRTAPGSKLMAALRADQVAFEIDDVDEVWEEGWSVLATGRMREVTDDDELREVRQLPLRPWAGGDRSHYLRFDIAEISGRRIV